MEKKLSLYVVVKTIILFPSFLIFFLLPLMILILLTSFIPNGKHLATKLYELFGYVGLKLVGVELVVSGAKKIDKNYSYLVVGNHPSTLDIFTHITALPVSIRFLTKTELFRIPIFGRVLKVLGLPRIDRKNASSNFDKINYSIDQVLKNKYSIMIFPEGKEVIKKNYYHSKKGLPISQKILTSPLFLL